MGSSPAWAIGFELVCLPAVDEELLGLAADAVDMALEDLESEDKRTAGDTIDLLEHVEQIIIGGPLIGTFEDWTWVTEDGIGLCVVQAGDARALFIAPQLEESAPYSIVNLSLGWHPE